MFQKASQLKDAILNSTSMPAYAMWKDESFGIPNQALLNLCPNKESAVAHDFATQREFLALFKVYTEDFSRELDVEEFPILQVVRSQCAFHNKRVGMIHPTTGAKMCFDVHGETIFDDSHTFLGGMVVFKDMTEINNQLVAQIRENAEQFDTIANLIPPMVWTTTPSGMHDWFSQRWYDYTGLKQAESIGEGWKLPLHPDDVPEAVRRWVHSLSTGEEYNTEYRCRRFDGEWRWMLGRALPLRDGKGRIVRWFGTSTDIHELVETRQASSRLREQLLRVIEHAQVTLWATDFDFNLTLLEGSLMWKDDPEDGGSEHIGRHSVGKNIFDVFCHSVNRRELLDLKRPIERILQGESVDELVEIHIDSTGRLFRSRCLPLYRTDRNAGVEGEGGQHLIGVIGVSIDVTGKCWSTSQQHAES
jgi:PAS domain S-box-containing protein